MGWQGVDDLLHRRRARVVNSKIPDWVAKCDTLRASCHPRQGDLVIDPGRRVCGLVGRGGGKTTAAKCRLLIRMLSTPDAQCRYFATTRGHAEELMWSSLKDSCERLKIQARWNESRLRMTMPNGATLHLVGCDNKRDVEKHRGLPNHEVIIDEGGSHDVKLLNHLIYRIIGPRLGDYGGTLVLIGTPSHVQAGPFWESTRPGSDISRRWSDRDLPEYSDWSKWSYHHWSLEDGAPYVAELANLWREALVEKDANGWTDKEPVWQREYLGRWAQDESEHIFRYLPERNQWDPPRHGPYRIAELPKGKEWIYVYGCDLGHGDDFSEQVFAFEPHSKQLFHVAEFTAREMYPQRIAKHLLGDSLDANAPEGMLKWTGWPVGHVADSEGLGQGYLDELRDVYGIPIKKAEKKDKHGAIELFNGDLQDGRIKILKDSRLEEQLQSLQWHVDDHGRIRERPGDKNDCTDAALYARREAHHQFGTPEPAPTPAPGSHAHIEALLQASEDALADPDDEHDYTEDWGDNDQDWQWQ